ncbi:retrovirus-related pol polyprotein from transposon TNT 1-94 [Tanacetum coccineum]|uniref:Retrovirus-related pol polyprotein from transposon TNT 1-94 n=1 Tax=Tanacetum coccineum TaxID=301880 RepID=A0ABQ5BMG6_9ASTR
MTSLADKSLLSGGDNKPPMLEKHLYDSWKSRMELYMMNRPHGRMILASVEKGPLVWPSVTEDGVTRLKEYVELTPAEAIQADCDIKAINIILQGLPTEIYALVSQHRVAKDLWEKIKLLMQGTSLTKQERECKLYDEFDKFTYKKGETLHEYYLRFTLLLNDMNIYKMPLEQFQVNTKFLNTLPDEWSKFVTDVKLEWDDPIDALISHDCLFNCCLSLSRYPTRTIRETTSYAVETKENTHLVQFGSNTEKTDCDLCYIWKGRVILPSSGTKPKRKRVKHGSNDKVLLFSSSKVVKFTVEEIAFLADPETSLMFKPLRHQDCSPWPILSWNGSDALNELWDYRVLTDTKGRGKELKEKQNVENSFSGSNEQFAEIVHLKQNLFKQVQEKECLMKTVSELKNKGQSAQTVRMLTNSKICYDHSSKQALGFEKPFCIKKARESKPKLYDVPDSDETLELSAKSPIDTDIVKNVVNLSVNASGENVTEMSKVSKTLLIMIADHSLQAIPRMIGFCNTRLFQIVLGIGFRLLEAHDGDRSQSLPNFMIQVRLKETVRRIRTDNGTEFVNQTLREYYEKVGISHETSVARSPQQNGVVERRNRTLIEAEDNHDIEVAHMGNDPYFGIPIPEVPSDQSSSPVVIHTIVPPDHQVSEHNSKWTKDHPLENIIGALDRPVSTRLQLHEQALFCYYDAFPNNQFEPKNSKEAFNPSMWIEVMQRKLHIDLYGEARSSAWYDMLSSFLISNDFSKGSVDPTMFIRREGNDLILGYSHGGEVQLVEDKEGCVDHHTYRALGRERIEFLINKLGMRSFTPGTLKQLADEVDE